MKKTILIVGISASFGAIGGVLQATCSVVLDVAGRAALIVLTSVIAVFAANFLTGEM